MADRQAGRKASQLRKATATEAKVLKPDVHLDAARAGNNTGGGIGRRHPLE